MSDIKFSYLKLGVMTALLVLTAAESNAKPWRGITPLKSTRTDVERLLGKSNDLGRYELENERAYIFYSDGPCSGRYQNFAKQKCECLVEKDTVLRIAVTLERHVNASAIEKAKLSRKPLRSNVHTSTYSDLADGVVYTVNESEGTLTAIDYWPSATDCTQIVNAHVATLQSNSWRGIRPLHSTRDDVERALGKPQTQLITQAYVYSTSEEKIEVLYSEGPCAVSSSGKWNVPVDTVLQFTVYPQRTLPLDDLELDKTKYGKAPDPNIPNYFFWVNRAEGIMIQTQKQDGYEQVISIEYSRSSDDMKLRCK
jgi:hypothetical protein